MPSNNPFRQKQYRRFCITVAIAACLPVASGSFAQEPSESCQSFADEQMIEAQNTAERTTPGADVEKTVVVAPRHVVVLTWKHGLHERIVDLQCIHGKSVVAWMSSRLDEYFEVTTKDDFQLVHTPEFDGVTFRGCEAHMCDSTRGIYLYVPKVRELSKRKLTMPET